MNKDFYEITIKYNLQNFLLIFCKEDDYTGMNIPTTKFTDTYIYEDDSIVEVINKIKLAIKKHIDLVDIDFNDLAGFLSCEWTYYSNIKIKQFLHNHKSILKSENVNDLLKTINLKTTEKTIDNLDTLVDSVERISKDELVVGLYMYSIENNYKYYVNSEEMRKVIEGNFYINNEYTRPINTYQNYFNKNYLKNTGIRILKFTYTIVENPKFVKYNRFMLPDEETTMNVLEDIYTINDTNLQKINNLKKKESNYFDETIAYLSLHINIDKVIKINDIFDTIQLKKEFPVCVLINEKDKQFKILKDKSNVPVVKNVILSEIISDLSNVRYKNCLLFKFEYIQQTTYLFNVYLLDNMSYYIIDFDLENNNINNVSTKNIIDNINRTFTALDLYISDKSTIETIDHYKKLINNGYISINNNKKTISSKINLILNLSKYDKKNHTHMFLDYLLTFNTMFDINIKAEQISVLYKKDEYTINKIELDEITLNNGTTVNSDEFSDIKIKNSTIDLYYKKSYNSDSYNLIVKFIQFIMTNSQKEMKYYLNNNFMKDSKKSDKFMTIMKSGTDDIWDKTSNTTLNEIIEDLKINTEDEYIKNLINNANEKTKVSIIIDNNMFYISVINCNNYIELDNIKKIFTNYYYSVINNLHLEHNLDMYYIDERNYTYKSYNNIYNLYNHNQPIQNTEYDLYKYFLTVYNKKLIKKELSKSTTNFDSSMFDSSMFDSFFGDSGDDDSDDEDPSLSPTEETDDSGEDSDISSEDDDTVENYPSEDTYLQRNLYNVKKELYKPIFDNAYIKQCIKDRRPSIKTGSEIDLYKKKESTGKIRINKKPADYLNRTINNEDSVIDITVNNDKFDISTKDLYMGRLYTFNIKYEMLKEEYKDNRVVMMYIDNISKKISYNIDYIVNDKMINRRSRLRIIDPSNSQQITLNSYINSNFFANSSKEFIFKLNFDESKLHLENDIVFILFNFTKGQAVSKPIILKKHTPNKYYYDNDIFGDRYFMCLPGTTQNQRNIMKDANPHYDEDTNSICCYSNAPHQIKELKQNTSQVPYPKKDMSDFSFEKIDHYSLKHLKLGKIPDFMYNKIVPFLSLKPHDEYYSITEKTLNEQPYRLGISYNRDISNLLLVVLYSIKLDIRLIKLPKISKKTMFEFLKNDQSIVPTEVEKDLILCINDRKILPYESIIKITDGIYSNIDSNLKNSMKLVKLMKGSKVTNKKNQEVTNVEKQLRTNLVKYIKENFDNLDQYLIWNLLSHILKINIVIFEIKIDEAIQSYISCPLTNSYNIYDFENNKTCFLLNFHSIYQPIIIKRNDITYNILFDLKESHKSLYGMFRHCSLSYNDSSYNSALINSAYYNVDISSFYTLNSTTIDLIKDSIKYIVVNEDYIKLGIIIEFKYDSKTHSLFIPINYIKHNINYANYTDKEYIFMFNIIRSGIYIKSIDETIEILDSLYEFNKNYIMNNDLDIIDETYTKEELLFMVELLNINKERKFIIDDNTIVGIEMMYGDYIPVIPIKIDEFELKINDKLTDDHKINGIISYIHNKEIDEELDVDNYIHYELFIQVVSNIISKNSLKLILLEQIDLFLKDKDKTIYDSLRSTIVSNIKKLFKPFVDEMPKLTFNKELNICNTTPINKCDYNCVESKNKCKFQITKELFNTFVDYLLYDLIYNNYKRVLILDNLIEQKVLSKTDENHIIMNSRNIDDLSVNNLYNKLVSSKYHHILGLNRNNITVTDFKNNTSGLYCSVKKKIKLNVPGNDNIIKLKFYNFKSLLKDNTIAYSNCIYYNIGRHVLNIKNNEEIQKTRHLIASQVIEVVKESYGENAFILLKRKLEQTNKSYIYNSTNSIDELYNLLLRNLHWITEFELNIFGIKQEKLILIFEKNKPIKQIGYTPITNRTQAEIEENTIILYKKQFYYKPLYYLVNSKHFWKNNS